MTWLSHHNVRFGSLTGSRRIAAIVASSAIAVGLLSAPTAQAAPRSGLQGGLPPATLTPVVVPGTTPLGAAAVNLGVAGYTEREFYADGVAHRYRGAVVNATANAAVVDGNWPYRTRVLVRTPDRRRFNGTLIVEWTNVTIGVDADFVFAEAHADLLRLGYAYAVVSVQKVGVDRLKSWSPNRYGTLSVNASNVDPQTGGDLDACRAGTSACAGDPLSWDVFTEVSKALKVNSGSNAPFPGLRIQNVIATGQSQSAGRLTSYYNAIQPLYRFFDGFVFWDRASAALRPEVATPSVSVNSEGLSPLVPPFGTSNFSREWEVAGSTHGSTIAEHYVDAMFTRDKSLIGPNGQPQSFTQWVEPSCQVLPAFSPVPNGEVVAAATESVKKWIEKGRPAAPSIYFDRDVNGQLLRDADGNIKGGIRLSEFAVPTSKLSALNGTAFPCSVSGWHRDYTGQELRALYGNHARYVSKVASAETAMAASNYLLWYNAAATVKEAARSSVGR